MFEMGIAASMIATLALAAPQTGTERITKQNVIETILDIVVTKIPPRVCVAQARRFESSLPEAAQMSQAAREAYLRNREERCARELMDRFGVSSDI